MHTPGPWKRRLTPSKKPGTLIEPEAGGKYIASVNYRGSFDEIEANAHLIATAPEMFAALQDALGALDTEGGAEELCERIRVTLAKAQPSKQTAPAEKVTPS